MIIITYKMWLLTNIVLPVLCLTAGIIAGSTLAVAVTYYGSRKVYGK